MSAAEGPLLPADERELADAVGAAAAAAMPLAVSGGGTRAGLGRPVQAARSLSTRQLTGITLYEPAEMVIAARAGTRLSEVTAALDAHGQRLAFEPMDHRPLLGSTGEPTVGALAAANVSGPARIAFGAARDALIGLRAVDGRGAVIKSGGRVTKNVTGYDLVKLLSGSYGTLAVFSEVTFKVLPKAETEATLVLTGLHDAAAVGAMSAALGSPFEVTGAAHRPGRESDRPATFIRLEGFAASVADRAERLRQRLGRYAPAEILGASASRALWLRVRDLAELAAPANAPVWRVSVKPSDGPPLVEAVRRSMPVRVLYEWGGGLVWLAGGEGGDAGTPIVRAAVAGLGGHATLVRAPDAVRAAVDVFQPEAPALAALSRQVKQAFDPAGILNPGRMRADT